MKKFNYNMITTITITLLIVTGWFSITFLEGIKDAVEDFVREPKLSSFVEDIDEASTQLSYRGKLIDISSYVNRISGKRIIEKSDSTIVRLDNGYLNYKSDGVDEETLEIMASRADALKKVGDDLGIPFIYVMAPTKSYFDSYPQIEKNEFRESFCKYEELLNIHGIDVLNLGKKMEEQNISMEEAFFITDHHWTPEMGLWATNEICKYMEENYQFKYDDNVLDISNYKIDKYEDFFLGSQGKKVGRYFTPLGLDDITLLEPKFSTNLTVSDMKGTRKGTYSDTLIQKKFFDDKNLYTCNPYIAYTGGDFPLQEITNHMSDNNGQKIILFRDSFSCVVSPFLSLTLDSLHTIDMRHWEGTKTANTVEEYIRQEKPDYILILYSDLIPTMLEFEKTN